MRRILCAILLFTFCQTIGQAQSLDSLLGQLPSRADYYTPTNLPDSWIQAGDSSSRELVRYLADKSITIPQVQFPYLSTLVSLPWVVRPLEAIKPLSISVPTLGDKLETSYADRLLSSYRVAKSIEQSLWYNLQSTRIDAFSYTVNALASDREHKVVGKSYSDVPQVLLGGLSQKTIKDYANQLSVDEIQRKYWIPGFESSIQFSQNYISDNWHKGGTSNLNLQMRNYLSLTYSKDKVRWLGELESKLGLYHTGTEKDGDRYRINEDLLRLHSNYGIKFNKHWSYTIDGELRTQLFNIYNSDNTILQSAPFAPLKTNIGVGLQYSYIKKSKQVYGRSFSLDFNIAPISHNWRWSHRSDIALSRHGLSLDKLSLHTFGSTIRGLMQWNINMDVSWTSRVYYNSSYSNVEAEWENTLVMRISRYFSTRINLQLRFDDSEAPSPHWNKHLQINELLSFGFNYKL